VVTHVLIKDVRIRMLWMRKELAIAKRGITGMRVWPSHGTAKGWWIRMPGR
jgi:hypothetical protein